jgi:hypothetical protein
MVIRHETANQLDSSSQVLFLKSTTNPAKAAYNLAFFSQAIKTERTPVIGVDSGNGQTKVIGKKGV